MWKKNEQKTETNKKCNHHHLRYGAILRGLGDVLAVIDMLLRMFDETTSNGTMLHWKKITSGSQAMLAGAEIE